MNMKEFVSRYGISVAMLAAALSFLSVILRPDDSPWLGLVWVVLAVSAVVLCAAGILARSSKGRSMAEVIDDVEAEPLGATPKSTVPPAVHTR